MIQILNTNRIRYWYFSVTVLKFTQLAKKDRESKSQIKKGISFSTPGELKCEDINRIWPQ